MRGFGVRNLFTVICLICAVSAGAQDAVTADALLQRGREHFRGGRYAEAAVDLAAAAQQYLSSEEMNAYVQTGRFAKLAQFETALVYLALAHSRLGHEEEARQAVLRLATAERIAPTYSTLPLEADAAEFETLAPALVPGINLGANVRLAQGGVTPPPPSAPSAAPVPAAAVASATSADRIALVQQMVAQECSRIQREADEMLAAVRREADERVAREREAARREANERVSAIERAAAERVAEIERAAEARIAAAEASARAAIAEAERQPERVVVAPTPTPTPSSPATPEPQPATRTAESLRGSESSALLRRASEFSSAGRFAEAREIYARVAAANADRAARVQAAVGLYRIGAYRDAAVAFDALAPFVRGEEDLRYYNAVSLFESGRYEEARFELSCALPFIRMTDDVIRYRTRIEQMVAWQHALTPVDAVQ